MLVFELEGCSQRMAYLLGKHIRCERIFHQEVRSRLREIDMVSCAARQRLDEYENLTYNFDFIALAGQRLESAYKKLRSFHKKLRYLYRHMMNKFHPAGHARWELREWSSQLGEIKARIREVRIQMLRDNREIASLGGEFAM